MPMLIIRPVLFAVLFFILSVAIQFLVSQFLPELLEEGVPDESAAPFPGSRINITEGDSPLSAQGFTPNLSMPSFMSDESSEGSIGDISNLLEKNATVRVSAGEGVPAGIDQNGQEGYNQTGEVEDLLEPDVNPEDFKGSNASSGQAAVPSAAPNADSVDFLPDLESMAGAFMPAAGNAESDTIEYSVSTPSPRSKSGGKAPAWSGDFNAKELAAGLRTVLNKEKEG